MGTLLVRSRSKKLRNPLTTFESKLANLHLLELTFHVIYDPCFDDAALTTTILAPMPGLKEFLQKKAVVYPDKKHMAPEVATLYGEPLLSREQEFHLFRKMNYLKYHAKKIIESKPHASAQQRALSLLTKAATVRHQLISCNLRLAMRFATDIASHNNLSQEVFVVFSEANLACIKAVDCFDWTRGLKFSTYATWAIKKNLWRDIKIQRSRQDHCSTGYGYDFFEKQACYDPNNQFDEQERQNFIKNVVATLLDKITEKDGGNNRRSQMLSDYNLSQEDNVTLADVGNKFGVTKERVRQLNNRTLKDMRKMLLNGEVPLNGIAMEFLPTNDDAN